MTCMSTGSRSDVHYTDHCSQHRHPNTRNHCDPEDSIIGRALHVRSACVCVCISVSVCVCLPVYVCLSCVCAWVRLRVDLSSLNINNYANVKLYLV